MECVLAVMSDEPGSCFYVCETYDAGSKHKQNILYVHWNNIMGLSRAKEMAVDFRRNRIHLKQS